MTLVAATCDFGGTGGITTKALMTTPASVPKTK